MLIYTNWWPFYGHGDLEHTKYAILLIYTNWWPIYGDGDLQHGIHFQLHGTSPIYFIGTWLFVVIIPRAHRNITIY